MGQDYQSTDQNQLGESLENFSETTQSTTYAAILIKYYHTNAAIVKRCDLHKPNIDTTQVST